MYLAPDDMEVGMYVLGTVATFAHDAVAMDGSVTAVTNRVWDHANKVYKIKAKQFPYIVLELAWNEQMVCIGKVEMVDIRYHHFIQAEPTFLQALKVKV